MTTPLDRSAPGVRLTLLASERVPSGQPLDLTGRLLSFTYEDSASKADQVSLQLDNFDLALFEREELVGGSVFEVSWGYPGHMAPPRRVVLKKLKGFQTLTVEGLGHQRADEPRGPRRAPGRTRLAPKWLGRWPLSTATRAPSLVIEDTREVFDVINQAAETDARFLRRLASRARSSSSSSMTADCTGAHATR